MPGSNVGRDPVPGTDFHRETEDSEMSKSDNDN